MISIELSPEAENKLQRLAQEKGQDPAVYLRNMVEEQINAPCDEETDTLAADIWRMTHRTPEEIMEARERLLAASKPGRELPSGKTLADMVVGKWPGDETDEEINALLEALS